MARFKWGVPKGVKIVLVGDTPGLRLKRPVLSWLTEAEENELKTLLIRSHNQTRTHPSVPSTLFMTCHSEI